MIAWEPFAAKTLPELPSDVVYVAALRNLVTAVNGMPYHGAILDGIVHTVRVLRADPDLARRLLDTTEETR